LALGRCDAPGAAEVSCGSHARGRGATCGAAHRSKTGECGRSVRCWVIDWNGACDAFTNSWTGEPGGGPSPSY